MRSIDDINPIDELIARVGRIPAGGDRERVDLAAARRELDRVFDEAALGRRARGPRSRRWRRSRASVPLIVSCLVVALIAVLALLVLRPSPVARHGSPSRPAATSAADALIAKLAVLRRPQTSADRLPRNLKLNREANGVGLPQGTHWGVILPSLSRLVATPPGARLYLVVTTPVSGSQALWRASLGDQVTILVITAHGATEHPDTLPWSCRTPASCSAQATSRPLSAEPDGQQRSATPTTWRSSPTASPASGGRLPIAPAVPAKASPRRSTTTSRSPT